MNKTDKVIACGDRFGRLEVIAFGGKDKRNNKMWVCKCDCGNTKTARGERLLRGATKSCGCIVKEGFPSKTHGDSKTILYQKWEGMRARCERESCDHYKYYGAKGIKVCCEWEKYEAFRDWALSNGYAEDLSIERKDVNGGYNPENCTWIPMSQQSKNKNNNLRITINGVTKIAVDWARECGFEDYIIYKRYKAGDRGERLLREKQIQKKNRLHRKTWENGRQLKIEVDG